MLTAKQRLFIAAYLGKAKGNATLAAKMAGYKGTDRTLAQVGAENLAKPYIAALIEKKVESLCMSADEVLQELSKVAKGSHKIYRSDKIKSLELIGKHHRLFIEKTELTINVSELSDQDLEALTSAKG